MYARLAPISPPEFRLYRKAVGTTYFGKIKGVKQIADWVRNRIGGTVSRPVKSIEEA